MEPWIPVLNVFAEHGVDDFLGVIIWGYKIVIVHQHMLYTRLMFGGDTARAG